MSPLRLFVRQPFRASSHCPEPTPRMTRALVKTRYPEHRASFRNYQARWKVLEKRAREISVKPPSTLLDVEYQKLHSKKHEIASHMRSIKLLAKWNVLGPITGPILLVDTEEEQERLCSEGKLAVVRKVFESNIKKMKHISNPWPESYIRDAETGYYGW